MNIQRKLELVKSSIQSISQHTDQDSVVRVAALDKINEIVAAEKAAIEAETKARVEAAMAG